MRKKKLQLVPDKGKPEISNLSPEEEARVLNLADIALHNPTATNNLCATDSGRERIFDGRWKDSRGKQKKSGVRNAWREQRGAVQAALQAAHKL
jgi:hypothetical protein